MTCFTYARAALRLLERVPLHFLSWALVLAGCADGTITDPTSGEPPPIHGDSERPLLLPPAAGRGVQFTMQVNIPAGIEAEYCQFYQTDEEHLLNHDQVRFSAGSHHVLMWVTPYYEIPTHNDFGEAIDTSAPFDCSSGVQNGWSTTGLLAGSQTFDGDSVVSLPKGVAVRLPAGTVLLANVHYINPLSEELDARAYVNLHTIPESELQQEGGLLFWYNPYLKVPAHGRSRMTASCPVTEAITLSNAQSHMHSRGVGYEAVQTTPKGARRTIYTGNQWEDVEVRRYDPGLAIAAGSTIEWSCDYQNSLDRAVYQGPRTTDEMCVLIGSYYPRNDRIGYCQRDDSFATRWTGAKWSIGQGSANCAQSLECVKNGVAKAAPDATRAQRAAIVTECMLAASPAVASPLSRAIACLNTQKDAATACVAEFDACLQQ